MNKTVYGESYIENELSLNNSGYVEYIIKRINDNIKLNV